MRKRLDFTRPVPMSVIEECLQIAIQAPSGSNSQGWHFLVVTDAAKKAAIARWYQKSFADYIAYTLGTDFKPAPRKPLAEVLHRDEW